VGGDIYLIGTTNVGKSSIFNLLLESDLCSIKAIDRETTL
jgi:ribosome biogenesis GTPase A